MQVEGLVDDVVVVDDDETAAAAAAPKASRFPLWILISVATVDQADRYLLSTVFPLVKQEFHLSDAQLGSLSAAFVVVGAVGVVPFGILVDRYVRTRIVAWGCAIWSWAMIITGLAGSYRALFGARMFLGVAESTYGPAGFSLVNDYYPVRERGKMLGLLQLGNIAGFLFLPIGGLVAGAWGWRAAFHVYAIPGFLLAIVAFRLREPARGDSDREHQGLERSEAGATSAFARLASRRAFLYVVRIPTVLVSLISQGLTLFFLSGLGIWTATFLVRYHDFSLVQASTAMSLLAVGAIVGSLVGGWLGDRLVNRGVEAGRFHVAAVSQLVSVAILFPAFTTNNTPLMLVLFGIGACFLTMPFPGLQAVRADVVHPDLRGRLASVASLMSVITGALSPLVFGILSDDLGLRAAFLLSVPWMALGGLLIILLGPRFLARDADRMRRQLAGMELL